MAGYSASAINEVVVHVLNNTPRKGWKRTIWDVRKRVTDAWRTAPVEVRKSRPAAREWLKRELRKHALPLRKTHG
jgi:hypothetical protein